MRALLVHNQGAGDGRFDQEGLQRLIRAAGHEVQYFASSNSDWRRAFAAGVDLIVAAGGDGTVEKVARVSAHTGVPVAVIPLGTANNIATELGIVQTSVPDLINGWAGAGRRHCDIGVVRAHTPIHFVESAGLGLIAESIAEITEGGAGYVDQLDDAQHRLAAAVDVLARRLRSMQAVRVDFSLDGDALSGSYVLLEVLNFGAAGPNLRLAAGADPGDGLFDVVLVEESRREQLMEHLSLYRADPSRAPLLPTRRARQVTLSCANCHFHLDDQLRGTDVQTGEPIDLVVEERALTFLV